jgi:hypothetical protein
MLPRVVVIAAAGEFALVASCGESDSKTARLHAVPDDAQVVWGTASCRDSWPGGDLNSRVSSTRRPISGTETIEQFRRSCDGPGGP